MKISPVLRWGAIVVPLLSVCGCARPVISITGISTASQIPKSGQVHPYPNSSEKDDSHGPYHVLHIESEDDISTLAIRYTHHLYFSLTPCSQTERGYALWNGGVFIDARANATTSGNNRTGPKLNRYMVHIPIRVEPIIRNVRKYGALDTKSYLARANSEDVCVRMGGGQMWAASLLSNSVKTPLRFDEKTGLSVVN
jgi:hypothetical protein